LGASPPLGATEFVSAAPNGGQSRGVSADSASGAAGTGGGSNVSAPPAAKSESAAASADRKVEETDLYRVEGDRVYYLNAYRGLMVFDIADVDHPKLLGRSPIFGSPVEMIVRDGVATVVVADWYGHLDNGDPFHGSIVRGIDARDPANIKILGGARLGGWVRDTRVVGDVIYAVSEDYGWSYGWYGGGDVPVSDDTGASASGPQVIVSSVSFAGGDIRSTGSLRVPGWGGIFNVTKDAILFAHPADEGNAQPYYYGSSSHFALDYVDISDPGGLIKKRGSVLVDGSLAAYGTDNGRWNLDFADGKTAHILAQTTQTVTGYPSPTGFVLATADFTNPDAPVLASTLPIAGNGWSPAARFDGKRMYLAPAESYAYGSGPNPAKTPIQVYDIANAAAPKLVGQTSIPGAVWNFTPAGDRLFILGNEPTDYQSQGYYAGSRISVSYVDVTDASKPTVLGAAAFGEGWAWTPAAGTFKAFTKNDEQKLVVLPFSGWSSQGNKYNNGLQLIEFSPTAITKAGTANTKGWVERGVFAKGRLLSLSDLSLAVIDYTSHQNPMVVSELTLARNVIDARPHGETIAELSSDWWYGNDVDHSELRVLPTAQADENVSGAALAEVAIDGTNARVFHNQAFSYVVSNVRHPVACAVGQGETSAPDGKGGVQTCYAWTEQVQVIEYVDGKAVVRGKKELPSAGGGYGYGRGYGGFGGCYAYDWYYGNDVVQVGNDVLAFRRWTPQVNAAGEYVDAQSSLYVVDLANPDAPGLASTVITHDRTGWWGNMRTVGDTLYTSHYEWLPRVSASPSEQSDSNTWTVKYYLDRIDLRDRAHPAVGAKINVPGMLVGGSEDDPSVVYTVDYQWYGNHGGNDFDVLKLHDNVAELRGRVTIPGYVGSTFVRGNKAYMSVQQYEGDNYNRSTVQLWQLDLANPQQIVTTTSKAEKGWGWLLGVEGDRALVTSGWGSDGIDIYKLSAGAPVFDQFVRTVGWGASSMARQDNQIFLASGHWGVQTINLK